MEQNSESSIIQRARQGDQDAISRLYGETKNYAYFVARRYLQNDEDIADILQDAYISVFSNLGKFEDGRPFKPWLHSIVTNKCLNFIKSKRAVFVSVDEIGELAGDDEEIIPAAWLERTEKRRDIIRIIDGLPEGQRMAVTLFYFEGLSISDMAEIMGVAEGTVKAHLYYGRKTIKEEVLREEKKGNKLYAIVPLPLLTQLFELEAEAAVMPEAMSKAILEGTINSLAANGVIAGANAAAAGSAVTGSAGGVGRSTATASTATGLAAKVAAMSVTAKIIAVAAAAVVVTVGIIAGSTLGQPSAPVLSPAPIVDTVPSESSSPPPNENAEAAEPDAANINSVVGDIITFGTYNGQPIEWRVLEVADEKTLIITEQILTKRMYYGYFADVDGDGEVPWNRDEFKAAGGIDAFACTWETSELRAWLNDEFYSSSFDSGEQGEILQTTVSTPSNPVSGAPGGNDTSDKLFLLSAEEEKQYFTQQSARAIYDDKNDQFKEDYCAWHLRSQGSTPSTNGLVLEDGYVVYENGGGYVTNTSGVRPALWLTTPGTTGTTQTVEAEATAAADYASAYKQVLLDNRDAILGAGIHGYEAFGLVGEGDVNVTDINGDGIPELLFTLIRGSGSPVEDLHIYSYANDSAVRIFTMEVIRDDDEYDPFVEVLLSPDGVVMTARTIGTYHYGEEYYDGTFTTYEFDSYGMLVAQDSITKDSDNELTPRLGVLTYYRNGEVISESEHNQLLTAYTNSSNEVILFSHRASGPYIMSLEKAIDYLDSL